ncbi:hypothetical protein BAUCODRAFT_152359 [Baudoinia panamericana UAMH 10762]|uniref:Uncharacterized protein n=1 Tax=Baudoinia panamericana (strain UAMH 10762) TaxID=717646 RepID=M2MXT4_BAUPA|nr:uncharacterized protein BAUCODRAFT_152359 [Baudoinia panamericana UAMH 10762]EMC91060.1 hypothetical protein BAUCODRAFT_152359 [Baudoinia panamericana UAMH 10762]
MTWDLLVKIFNDLDLCLFAGDLYHRVRLRWSDLDMRRALGVTHMMSTPSFYSFSGLPYARPRVIIFLSATTDWSRLPQGLALGVLVHEMLHAYFGVWAPDAPEAPQHAKQDHGHGAIFQKAAKKLEQVLRIQVVGDTSDASQWPAAKPKPMDHRLAVLSTSRNTTASTQSAPLLPSKRRPSKGISRTVTLSSALEAKLSRLSSIRTVEFIDHPVVQATEHTATTTSTTVINHLPSSLSPPQ